MDIVRSYHMKRARLSNSWRSLEERWPCTTAMAECTALIFVFYVVIIAINPYEEFGAESLLISLLISAFIGTAIALFTKWAWRYKKPNAR